MTKWTDHLNAYSKKHGVSYKTALGGAKSSYKPIAARGHRSTHPPQPTHFCLSILIILLTLL